MPRHSNAAVEAPAPAAPPQCWIVVAPRQHVAACVAAGHVEINHGKATPLERMRPGDGITCYSPREADGRGPPLQAFTALGRVASGGITQAREGHQPFRRAVHWHASSPAPVKPLLDSLTFIRNRTHWGAAFRFGFLRVPVDDFLRIARAQGCDFALSSSAATAGTRPPAHAPADAARDPATAAPVAGTMAPAPRAGARGGRRGTRAGGAASVATAAMAGAGDTTAEGAP